MKASMAPGGLLIVSCLAALALTLLAAGACWAALEVSPGYCGGQGTSDVPDAASGFIIETDDYDIAVDQDGRPQAVWASPSPSTSGATASTIIRYAFWDGDSWRGLPDTDGPTDLGVGQDCAISILPGGWPLVTYQAWDPVDECGVLQGLFWSGSGWQTILSPQLDYLNAGCSRVAVEVRPRRHFVRRIGMRDGHGKLRTYPCYASFDGQSLQGFSGGEKAEGLAEEWSSIVNNQQFDPAMKRRLFHQIFWQTQPAAVWQVRGRQGMAFGARPGCVPTRSRPAPVHRAQRRVPCRRSPQ